MLILDEVINAIKIFKEKKMKKKVNKYFYPVLKTHKIIEKNEEEKRRKIIEEKRKEMDKIRFEKERNAFKEEDINIYKGEDEQKYNSETESEELD